MAMTEAYISELERQPHWQAIAEARTGQYVVIMRGYPGSEYFEKDYHIFDGETHNGNISYVVSEIKKMFESGTLTLVKGSIPQTENRPELDALPLHSAF
jgi:hypothetical protein